MSAPEKNNPIIEGTGILKKGNWIKSKNIYELQALFSGRLIFRYGIFSSQQ
jgi:hypothetical protein